MNGLDRKEWEVRSFCRRATRGGFPVAPTAWVIGLGTDGSDPALVQMLGAETKGQSPPFPNELWPPHQAPKGPTRSSAAVGSPIGPSTASARAPRSSLRSRFDLAIAEPVEPDGQRRNSPAIRPTPQATAGEPYSRRGRASERPSSYGPNYYRSVPFKNRLAAEK